MGWGFFSFCCFTIFYNINFLQNPDEGEDEEEREEEEEDGRGKLKHK